MIVLEGIILYSDKTGNPAKTLLIPRCVPEKEDHTAIHQSVIPPT
jgi:hypothetical protein